MHYERPVAEQLCLGSKEDILLMSGDNEQNVADLLGDLLKEKE